MITGGKLGQILGRKRAFAIGCVIYGCGSLPATPAQPDLLQLHVHLIGRFRLPVSLRLGLGLPLNPRGVLAAGVKLRPLRVDPARDLVRAGLQLIQPGGVPVVSGTRFGNLGVESFQLACLRLGVRLGLGYRW
jgi:hypothetical protein